MPSVPVVYNNANLFAWKSEQPINEQKIIENSRIIEEQRVYLKPFQEQLSSVDFLLSTARSQLAIEQMNANQDMMHHMHQHHHDHHHHHHHGDGAWHFVGDVMRAANISRLQSQIDNLNIQRGRLLSQMQPYEDRISQAQTKLNELHSRQAWLKKHVPAAEIFLNNLQANPEESVRQLISKLQKAFIDYEDKHLVGLSPQVRISLMAVRVHLYSLFEDSRGYAPHYANQIHLRNYLRLTGFIWDMYLRVAKENKDSQFAKILGELVENTHILQNGDLPDHLQTGHGANIWFEGNRQALPKAFAIQEWELLELEEELFNKQIAINNQRAFLYPIPPLHSHIMNALNLVDAEVKMKKKKHEAIDYHFYGRMARILNEVFDNPTDKHAAKRLADIAEYASGSASIGKQLLGGLIIVLGALLIAASIAGFAATFGSSSILSAWGAALGLNLMQAEIAFASASSVVAASGIGLTFFAGPSVIKSGQRQGLSQELMSIKDGIENYDGPPPVTAPQMPVW